VLSCQGLIDFHRAFAIGTFYPVPLTVTAFFQCSECVLAVGAGTSACRMLAEGELECSARDLEFVRMHRIVRVISGDIGEGLLFVPFAATLK